MAEFADPLVAYLVLFLILIGGAAATGWYLTEHITGFALAAVIIGILGFVSGLHVVSNQAEWFGLLIVMGIVSLTLAYFLPITVLQAAGVFVVGYFVGMRTERR